MGRVGSKDGDYWGWGDGFWDLILTISGFGGNVKVMARILTFLVKYGRMEPFYGVYLRTLK